MERAAATVHVLYVDDDSSQAKRVASALEREAPSFTVATASSAREGLNRLADADADVAVDCVVADYDLPDQTGIEFLAAVREAHPDLPFVLYTDAGSEVIASHAIAAGVTDYLLKGRDDDEHSVLADRIRTAVEDRTPTNADDPARRLDSFFEATPLGAIEWTGECTVRRVNEAAATTLGYGREELVGTSWETLVPDADIAGVTTTADASCEAGADTAIVAETVRKDGTRLVCEWHTRVVTDEDGDDVAAYSTVQDVSDRRRQRRQLETLIDNLPGMVYRCRNEPGWPMERVRGNVAELTGYSAATIEAEDGFYGAEILHPDDQDAVWEAVQEALDAGEPFEVTYRIVTRNGDTRWVWERGQAIDAADRALTGGEGAVIEGFVTDITAQKETAQALRAEREFVDQALDTLDDVFYVVGTDGDLRRWNAHVVDLTGYSPAALDGMDAVELFPAEDRTHIREGIDEALQTGLTVFEADLQTASGGRIPHEFTAARLTDTDGNPDGLVGIGRDVTDHRQYERRLTALHAVATDLTSVESVERVCERTMAASEEILAFDMSVITIEADGLLKPVAVSEEIPPDGMTDMPVDEGIAGRTYRTGESFLLNDLQTHPDANPQGAYRSVISVPIGEVGVFQAVAETADAFDESDLELAELLVAHAETALDRIGRDQRVADQNDRLNEFASIVSHDLRNPLNVVQGRIDLAREECNSAHLDPAANAVERCFALIDDLLTLAREGERVSHVEPVALGPLAADCWATVETGDATLQVDIERTVEADASQLTHVFENLFRNAIEHGSETVMVRVGALDDGFYVADDGPGIPEDDREQVFEAGYSTNTGGTGFGLNIVHAIAEAHGWAVCVAESADGGARFEFTGVDD